MMKKFTRVLSLVLLTGLVSQPASPDATTTIRANVLKGKPTVTISNNGGTLTLPTSTDTIVGRATTDTLTNKTMSGASNTFSNIGYSSLNLSTSIVNADVSGTAAIARSKIASGTNNHVVINDGSGVLSSEAALATSRGGTGSSSIGSANQVLGVNSGASGLEYKTIIAGSNVTVTHGANSITIAASAGVANSAVTSKTANYTLATSDDVILGDDSGGSFTLTLPTAVGNTGKIFILKKTNSSLSNAITIATTSSQTIDGSASGSYKLHTLNESYRLVSDGSNWVIMDHKTATPWTSYTPTLSAGYGSATSNVARWRRVGDTLEVLGSFVAGTTAASLASITLPSGLSIDTAKVTINNNSANPGNLVGDIRGNGTNNVFSIVTATSTDATLVYMSGLITNNSAALTPKNGNATLTGSEVLAYKFMVPISGWTE